MSEQANLSEAIQKMTRTESDEQALAVLEKVFSVAAAQNDFLGHLEILTLIVGPQGLAYYVASPGLLSSVNGLEMLDQAVVDLGKVQAERRKIVYRQAASQQEKKQEAK